MSSENAQCTRVSWYSEIFFALPTLPPPLLLFCHGCDGTVATIGLRYIPQVHSVQPVFIAFAPLDDSLGAAQATHVATLDREVLGIAGAVLMITVVAALLHSFRQFVTKIARSQCIVPEIVQRERDGRKMRWIHDVEQATPASTTILSVTLPRC